MILPQWGHQNHRSADNAALVHDTCVMLGLPVEAEKDEARHINNLLGNRDRLSGYRDSSPTRETSLLEV